MANERVLELKEKENYRAGLIIEDRLLSKTNGVSILETMLKNGENIPECYFNQRESIDLILKYKRYDLLPSVTIRNLLRNNKSETYLDTILNMASIDKSINKSFLNPFGGFDSLKDIADFYIIYAKHDMQDYLPPLSEPMLNQIESDPILQTITDKKSLIHYLLRKEEDRKLVKSKLLSHSLVQDLDIILELNDNDKEYKASIDFEEDYTSKYYEKQNSTLESLYYSLRPREQVLLIELKDLMSKRCDKKAVVVAMYSYIEQIMHGDSGMAISEIRRLIDIFKNDNTFTIKYGDESYFSISEKAMSLSSMSIGTFNHEMGHMFLHKLTDSNADLQWFNIIDNIRNKPEVLEKTHYLSKYFFSFNESIKNIAIKFYKEEAKRDLSPRNEKRILKRLTEEKKELIDEYTKRGYSKAVISNILNRSYTLEEYKRQHRKIQINMLRESIKKEKLGPIVFISDIIDAIYKGEFYAGKLATKNEISIKPISGHGLFYYNNNKQNIFDEIFANYCALRKCIEDNATYYVDPIKGPINKPMDCLRAIVGDELVNYLENYYQNKIINLNNYNESRRI